MSGLNLDWSSPLFQRTSSRLAGRTPPTSEVLRFFLYNLKGDLLSFRTCRRVTASCEHPGLQPSIPTAAAAERFHWAGGLSNQSGPYNTVPVQRFGISVRCATDCRQQQEPHRDPHRATTGTSIFSKSKRSKKKKVQTPHSPLYKPK